MRAVVDMDSILCGFFERLWERHEARTGEKVTTHQILSWNMSAHVKHGKELVEAFYEPGFFASLDPLPGAVRGLQALVDAGYDVLIASAPCTPHSAAEKIEWCARHLPMIPYKKVWIGHDKSELHGDVLIDDGPHNAEAYRAKHPHAKILSIAYPYNAGCRAYDLLAEGHKDPAAAWRQMIEFLAEE